MNRADAPEPHNVGKVGGEAAAGSGGVVLPLYTPAAAAELLSVRESWLRRRAAARSVPCTFLGKHLRFSHADLVAIAAAAARPATGNPAASDTGAGGSGPRFPSRRGRPRRPR